MNQSTASKQTRTARLALLAAVVLLGGCATHSTRYYADAGYGYYDSGYDDRWYGGPVVSTSIHVGSYGGYWDPWVYPYSSLDLFYFGPFAHRSSIGLYSPWVYVPFRHRYPFGYSFGYGHGYAGGFGHAYYGWGWPRWSSPRYYGHSGHRDRYWNHDRRHDRRHDGNHDRGRYRPPVDARVRALSNEPIGTPTRRALLGSWRTAQPTPGVTSNPSRAQLISNGSTRSALRGELRPEESNRSAARAPVAPLNHRSRLLAPADSSRDFDTRTTPRALESRRVLSTGTSRTPPRAATRSVAPAPQSRATWNGEAPRRTINNRSRVIDRTPATRSSNTRSIQSAPPPANRFHNRAPAPVSRPDTRIRQAAPAPQQRTIRAPASVRPAASPARSSAPARAVRPAPPPSQPSSRDRRREALSGRRDDGRRD